MRMTCKVMRGLTGFRLQLQVELLPYPTLAAWYHMTWTPPTSYSSPLVFYTSHYVRGHRYPPTLPRSPPVVVVDFLNRSKYPPNYRPSITPGITYTLHPVRGYVLFLFPRVRAMFCTPFPDRVPANTCYIGFRTSVAFCMRPHPIRRKPVAFYAVCNTSAYLPVPSVRPQIQPMTPSVFTDHL